MQPNERGRAWVLTKLNGSFGESRTHDFERKCSGAGKRNFSLKRASRVNPSQPRRGQARENAP